MMTAKEQIVKELFPKQASPELSIINLINDTRPCHNYTVDYRPLQALQPSIASLTTVHWNLYNRPLESLQSSIEIFTIAHWNLCNRPLESLQSSIANFTIVHKNRYPGFYIVVSCNCT